uniref:CBM20 domain-containing protein n=1 Tax=Cucumis melo TaxID=3656 RepID=A0A9I9E0M3_CUCME
MGTGASKNSDGGSQGNEEREENLDQAGGQLYISLKMENFKLKGELIPHIYGSVPLVGSWDSSKAFMPIFSVDLIGLVSQLSLERESASMWELSFVVPPNHESLDFKFLLKPRYSNSPCIVEEGPNRLLSGGMLQGDTRMALFRLSADEVLEYRVFIKADRVSPFDLAASWRAYQENLRPSAVRGIPDVSINSVSEGPENSSSASLELDLEHYVVPAPSSNSGLVYAANLTETPRSLTGFGVQLNADGSGNTSSSKEIGTTGDRPTTVKDMTVIVPDPSKMYMGSGMVESKSVGTFSHLQKQDSHRGLFVDRGVGSPRLVKSASTSTFFSDLKLDTESKNSMPAAAGAVAAAAVADQMLGPKEDRHLAIVLVGLPARGKTFTAAKLTRYLRWLGHETKHFNVGKYRRLKHGANQETRDFMALLTRLLSADFFRADNPEGMEARNEVAALAMEDMISWMQEGGQVGIFDATNSTRKRRNMLMKLAEGKCRIIFLETLCNDQRIIERNIRLKIQQSPDYAEEYVPKQRISFWPDFEAGYRDFKARLDNYEKVYEPVEEGSYIKMIDMVSGHGGQIQVNNISGYLPGRIVFFLVNTHLTPRPILLTRHGESMDNVRGRIGGDTELSEAGEVYSKKLANFVEKRLKSERAASIWTSTLQRTILTASPIGGFPKIQWRALDEIYAGVCDGMTYEEIKKNMPEEYEARKKDKLRYRYPRGESYLDVIQRLEPVIIELERQRAPVVVISHQAVLRALYAYFADRPLKEIPHIEVPLHTIIEIQMGVTGTSLSIFLHQVDECGGTL